MAKAGDRMLPKNVSAFRDRHGKTRYRYRKAGRPTVYFTAPLGSPEWLAELHRFQRGDDPEPQQTYARGTIDDLCERYYRSADFQGQGETSQLKNRAVIEGFRQGRGDRPVGLLTAEHLDVIFAKAARKRASADGKRQLGGPAAAQRLRKQLRRLFAHAVRIKLLPSNPVDLTTGVKYKTDGFHCWTEDEIAAFQARHPLGSRARLAMEIALWSGQRRGDVHRFGPSAVRGGRIFIEQEKKAGKGIWLPLAPQLRGAIDAMPSVGLTAFIVTEYGRPFSKAGFGNWFRDRCDEAGLPHCTIHGLRKAIGRRLADAGASQPQIKAVGDWTNDRVAAIYTASADQVRLAAEAFTRLVAAHELANPAEPIG